MPAHAPRPVRLALVGFGHVGPPLRRAAGRPLRPHPAPRRRRRARHRHRHRPPRPGRRSARPAADAGARAGPARAARSRRSTAAGRSPRPARSSRPRPTTCWSSSPRSSRTPASRPSPTSPRRCGVAATSSPPTRGRWPTPRAGSPALARRHGVRFLHEGAVMDGFPVFNLAGRCLRGVEVRAFRGVLNSTTTPDPLAHGGRRPVRRRAGRGPGGRRRRGRSGLRPRRLGRGREGLRAGQRAHGRQPAPRRRGAGERPRGDAPRRWRGRCWRGSAGGWWPGPSATAAGSRARVAPEELPLGDLLVSRRRRRRAGARHRPDGRGRPLGGGGRRGPDRLRGALRPARGGGAAASGEPARRRRRRRRGVLRPRSCPPSPRSPSPPWRWWPSPPASSTPSPAAAGC